MVYIRSAIGLRKQLLILKTLRDQASEKQDDLQFAQLSVLINRIETAMSELPCALQPPTLH